MADTIFTKIINREIPSHTVYEDDLVYAFLDINPLSPGHTLVVPKEPAAMLGDLSDESSAAIGRVLPRLCRAVCQATGCDQYNVLQNNGSDANQAVFHVHFHIIPKPTTGDHGDGLGLVWQGGSLKAEDGADLASKIAAAIES